MTGLQTGLLVGGIILFDSMFVCAMIHAVVSGSFGTLARKCPEAPELCPGAEYREFQDMKFGLSGFGKCVHIGVDENGLHLFPARILRWAGARRVMIPWTSVEVGTSSKAKGLIPCTLAGVKAHVPAWCFDGGPQEKA